MNLRTIAAIGAAAATASLAVPALVLARVLHENGFRPAHDRNGPALDLQVTAVGHETVTLRASSRRPAIAHDASGHYLLEGGRGWGEAGPVIESNGLIAIREYRHGAGELRAGDHVRLDAFAHRLDPNEAHGLAFEEPLIASPLGNFPAWYVRGSNSTWAIMTHGKGADRREALRILPALAAEGFHCLAITYRNDAGLPAASGGVYSYGRDEWEELDAAVEFALANGATNVVLVGYSMGGAISLSFMQKSDNAGVVSALILDAPMVDLVETVKHGARHAGVPVRVLPLTNRVAAVLYRFKWDDFDYWQALRSLSVPVLLFHGDADRTIPVELSDSVAATRPDIVQYVRVAGCDHVRAWNADPAAYAETVREFVRTHAGRRAHT